ncbi:PD-(D/E)XK nuclease-like domain-containing protein [Nocardia puris]|uniref:PDDEXK-like uncharacterized protein DUF3799 n=1 Tax=Nocardia puris TaxID=208602 RepID=A0A366DC85_9NOCA|nr:PD-(D/E)XK nuclease-like domain-containing protein [Nocardia puris]RBO87555.1 PDDEXK-like uncharacterized protein DUF3799 [Nocardia puris]
MTAPTAPGIYRNVPEAIYHGDRASISSSQARRLLEVTPYRWRAELDRPRKPSTDMEWGTALHTLVLGTGAYVVDTGAEKWTTNAVKDEVAEIRRRGHIPLRPKDFDAVHEAAEAVRAHDRAAEILAEGEPELSAWAPDYYTGVMMRARFDWLRWVTPTSVRVADVKKSAEVTLEGFRWSVGKFGYHAQQDWYETVLDLLGIRVLGFEFIVVTSEPPHEVYVVELPPRAADLGRLRNRHALDIYAECTALDEWPTTPSGTTLLDLPETYYRREEYIS